MKIRITKNSFYILFAFIFLFINEALCCDDHHKEPHTSIINKHHAGAFSATLSSQFSKYQYTEDKSNHSNKRVTRTQSTTQFIAGYDFSDSLGFQVNIPFVIYDFDTTTNYRQGTDTDSGIGDISFIANYFPSFSHSPASEYLLTLYAGIKVPTGDSGSVKNKINTTINTERTIAIEQLAHHTSTITSSKIGDTGSSFLTLGTGSFDFPFGTSFISRFDRTLLLSSLLYTIRTEGSFDFRFSNDFSWNVGTGYYLLVEHEKSISISALVSGEHKSEDKLSGEKINSTSQDNFFIGPQINAYLGDNFTGGLGFDLPIKISNVDAETSPEYRIRALISYNF